MANPCYVTEWRPGLDNLMAHQRVARTNARIWLRVECGMMPSQKPKRGLSSLTVWLGVRPEHGE